MSPCEWRNKHKKCKWCAYFRKRDMRYLLFPVLEPDGFCTAKDKVVYSKIPRKNERMTQARMDYV